MIEDPKSGNLTGTRCGLNSMEVKVIIQSEELSREELRLLIQAIRDCEQKSFPDKEIALWIEVPQLTKAECAEILTSIKPPYKYGPITLDLRR